MGFGFILNCNSLVQEVELKYFGRSLGCIALDSKSGYLYVHILPNNLRFLMKKFLFNIACLFPVFTCVYADELPPGISGAKLSIPVPELIGGAKEAPSPSLSELKDGIERSYVSNASLSDEDVKIVLELAKKSGISKVAKISTHYMLPTSMRSIKVEGVPVENGREISRSVLSVTRKSWSFPDAKPGKTDIVSGEFWARKPYVRKQVILKVGGNNFLCNSINGMSYEEAESIFDMFLAGKYTAGPEVRKRGLEQVDWTKPTHFRKSGDSIQVGFLADRESNGFFDLEITLGDKGIQITRLMQAVP